MEVVTAEDIGKLPAKNVADTLQRLPGVNVGTSSAGEGGFDENDRISLRGTAPSMTQTLVDGHNIGTGSGRAVLRIQGTGDTQTGDDAGGEQCLAVVHGVPPLKRLDRIRTGVPAVADGG